MAVKRNPEIRKTLIALSFVITVFLLMTIIIVGSVLDSKREDYLSEEFERLYRDFNNIQIYSLLSESYDDDMACLAFESKLVEMDSYIWNLGEKIDKYRAASEEFQKDEYYINQKKIFNENELVYLLLMNRMIKKCNISKQVILFFYQNSADCRKCDDQSFILNDISLLDDEDNYRDTAIFSFDMDLNLSTLNLLSKYYEIEKYPCIIINEEKYCGIQDKLSIMNRICSEHRSLDVCQRHFT